ncbi:unnamed protein product [Lactuca saligna]|uniref:Uncharacterized protein n=1 Tax=Lactuca saligna TaxID=75948 RepID=A0AA35Z1P3_LACSI|nr:unnamed protein product [Lactuca saligna]
MTRGSNTPLVCVTSSVCEAQTTRRHNGLQSVCFSEVRRHKNVCVRSSPHRYGIASSKVCKPFNLLKTHLFFLLPPPVLVQPSQKKPSIDRSYSTLQRPPPSQPSSPIKTIDRRLPLRSGVLRFSDHHSRLQQPANNKVIATTSTSDQAATPPLLAAVNQRLPCEATGRRPSPPQLHWRLRPHSYSQIHWMGIFKPNTLDAMDDDGVDTSHHEPPPSAASPSAASPSAASPSAGSPDTATPSGNPNKRSKPSTPVAPSASPSASSPDGTSVTADDLAFEMKKALQSLTKGYTIPQCLEKLEVLRLGPTDPLRFVAYHIFGGTMNMREMWMHLPNVPEILRGWLEMTGTSLGVLKDGKIVR